jgi:thiamine-phosphate pyrophosphorylase
MTEIPRLHLIGLLDVTRPVDFLGIATRAAAGGCRAIHVRAPGHAGGDVYRMALSLRRELAVHPGTMLLINDRIDVALLAMADGVQLGERGFDVEDARRLMGERATIGRSVHDSEGAGKAAAAGANFLVAGHVYDTPSKEGQPGRGLAWLAELVEAVDIPVIAIGGVTVERVPELLATGAHGVAVGRELLNADDPMAMARRICRHIDQEGGS